MKKEILRGLNEEQLKAVTFKDKPLLIVAGAGTGKTRVITHRIAYLIATHDISPSNVLALTFSRKAAFEMLERVEALIDEHKDELWVMTFHGFCHRVLMDHALEANIPRNFKLLNRVDSWIFFKELLPQLNLKLYQNLSDPTYPIYSFLKFISRAKDELVSPQDYRRYAEAIKEPDERSRALEIADVYDAYQGKMCERGFLDFGDLITMTMKLLRGNKRILDRYRDKFKYLLVDEFQDTNVAQIELASLLAEGDRAISVVGDDDQGIYRFRGASYASFLKFKDKFKDALTIRLTQNYRSTKRILRISDCLIKHNGTERFDPEKALWSDEPEGPKAVAIKSAEEDFESRAIADEIQSLAKNGVSYSEIAILYRAHAHKDNLLELLRSEGIPCVVSGKLGIFEEETVKDIIALLKAIDDLNDNASLFRVLSMGFFGIELRELIEITRHAKSSGLAIFDVLKQPTQLKLKPKTLKAIAGFIKLNDELFKRAYTEDARSLLYFILDKTGYIKYGDDKSRQAFGRFMRVLGDYLDKNEDQSLAGFLNYLDSFIQAGGDIEEDEPDDGEPGVRFLTVHQAKGLEFEYVFVIGLNQGKFPTRKREDEISFPVELMKENLPQGDFHIQEERRLFYVALTRAKKGLYLSFQDRPYVRPSIFLKEISNGKMQDDLIELDAKDYGEKKILRRSKKPKGQAYLTVDVPAPPNYSFSQIEAYMRCPLQYKFHYLIGIPSLRRPHLVFGSLMHETLEKFFILIKDKAEATKDKLIEIYESSFTAVRFADPHQKKAYHKEGRRMVEGFYDKNKDDFKVPLYLEEEFLLKINGHKLKGVIDRIDPLDEEDSCEIIDYKTGSAKDKSDADKNLQLSIYAIAVKELLHLKPRILSFYNLTTNEKVSSARTDEDLSKAKEKVLGVISKIASKQFDATPGRHCRWCDFAIACPYEKK